MWPISMPRAISSGDPHTGQGSPSTISVASIDAVGREVAAVDEVDHVVAGRVGAGDPSRALDDARVDDEPDARRAVGAERPGPDVALHERRVGGEVVLGERLDLGRGDLRLEPLEVDLAVAGHADRERLDGAVGMAQLDDHVLQRVAGVPARGHRRHGMRRRSSRAFSRSTSVAIVGVSGVSATRAAGTPSYGTGGGTGMRTASVFAA